MLRGGVGVSLHLRSLELQHAKVAMDFVVVVVVVQKCQKHLPYRGLEAIFLIMLTIFNSSSIPAYFTEPFN